MKTQIPNEPTVFNGQLGRGLLAICAFGFVDVRKPYAICTFRFVNVRTPYAICIFGFVDVGKPHAICILGFVDVGSPTRDAHLDLWMW